MNKHISSFILSILFSNLFIGLIAVLMAWEATSISGDSLSMNVYLFIFSLTTGVYAGYSLLDSNNTIFPFRTERSEWNLRNKRILIAVFSASVFSILFLTPSMLTHTIWFIPAAMGTLVYFMRIFAGSKKIFPFGILKTILLSMVWLYTTYVIPHGILGDIGSDQVILLGLVAGMPILSICILFDLRDNEIQLFHRNVLVVRRTIVLFILLSLLSMFVLDSTTEFQFVVGKILVLIFLRVTVERSLSSRSPVWYYGVLDGLMGIPFARLLEFFN